MGLILLVAAGLAAVLYVDHILKTGSRPVELRVPNELREHILRRKS